MVIVVEKIKEFLVIEYEKEVPFQQNLFSKRRGNTFETFSRHCWVVQQKELKFNELKEEILGEQEENIFTNST